MVRCLSSAMTSTEWGIGGNKVRNLEYLLGHAIAEGKNTVMVSGQTQSNLCSLCATHAAGWDCGA